MTQAHERVGDPKIIAARLPRLPPRSWKHDGMANRRVGRPRKTADALTVLPRITVAMDAEFIGQVDNAADNTQMTRSEIVRQALAEYLANHPELAVPADQEALIAS